MDLAQVGAKNTTDLHDAANPDPLQAPPPRPVVALTVHYAGW
jgi:hypothetical protein